MVLQWALSVCLYCILQWAWFVCLYGVLQWARSVCLSVLHIAMGSVCMTYCNGLGLYVHERFSVSICLIITISSTLYSRGETSIHREI